MGPDYDFVQGAVVFSAAVVCALLDGTFNAVVGVTVHLVSLLYSGLLSVCAETEKENQE